MGGSLGKKRVRWHILKMDGKVLIYQNSGNKNGRRHHHHRRSTIEYSQSGTHVQRQYPQGGVLPSLMWSIVIDELLKWLSVGVLTCLVYADDIVIIARGKLESTLCEILQEGIIIMKIWRNTVRLSVNPAKSTLVPFTSRTKLCDLRTLKMIGEDIVQKTEVKYLGIMFDKKLLWNQQVYQTVR